MKFKRMYLSIFLAAFASALMAGLFFSWSVSVIPGLGKLTDADYIRSFQSLNRGIQNPVFFLFFMGILVLLPWSTYMSYIHGQRVVFVLLLTACITYYVGVFAVTAIGNVPMNNILDRFQLAQAAEEMIHQQRIWFEGRWNLLNHVRTFSSSLTCILVLCACLSTKQPNL